MGTTSGSGQASGGTRPAPGRGSGLNVFGLRDRAVADYGEYVRGFFKIKDPRVAAHVEGALASGALWPEPWVSLNPGFAPGGWIDELVERGLLHPECRRIFRLKSELDPAGRPLRLYRHQVEAIEAAATGGSYVLTTGTGSGKSLAYMVPIVDRVLREGPGQGRVKALVVYPMNALANSQREELAKFLQLGYPDGAGPVRFARYTGQESDDERRAIMAEPPDILLTNYVMLELILTRSDERPLVRQAQGLGFLVLDELHTYRGRQGADVAMLVRRTREACSARQLQCVGTSATMGSGTSGGSGPAGGGPAGGGRGDSGSASTSSGGSGSPAETKAAVAAVASRLFGVPVAPDRVIGETLQRATGSAPAGDAGFVARLRERIAGIAGIAGGNGPLPAGAEGFAASPKGFAADPEGFAADPLARWLESTLGLAEAGGRLVRGRPRQVGGPDGVAEELADLSGLDAGACAAAIGAGLLAGAQVVEPETGAPLFAFRLHQFVSRGSAPLASPEPEDRRHLTTTAQRFVPGDRSRVLLPLAFCRECGQDYYVVEVVAGEDGQAVMTAREVGDRDTVEHTRRLGFLHLSVDEPWPTDPGEVLDRLPEDWLEEAGDGRRVRPERRDWVPRAVGVHPDGRIGAPAGEGAMLAHLTEAPFRLCLSCGVSHAVRAGSSDLARLTTLGLEGRSTATTMLSLAILGELRSHGGGVPAKVLTFTDNRQDASLQAGHFNDFVQVSLLRSGLYRALDRAGPAGVAYDELAQRVFDALDLAPADYAAEPTVRYQAREETDRALRDVLGYRLHTDLRRGWRVTAPNLEQVDLLRIEYRSLAECCADAEPWRDCHPVLSGASPAVRSEVCRTLLDHLRRELAVKADYLSPAFHERLRLRSSQHLAPPWAIDENEVLDTAAIAFPRPGRRADSRGWLAVSSRSSFGTYLRHRAFAGQEAGQEVGQEAGPGPGPQAGLEPAEVAQVVVELFEVLAGAGLVARVVPAEGPGDVAGYQVAAAALRWVVGEGRRAPRDLLRVPRAPAGGGRVNGFFVRFYREVAPGLRGLRAAEHTAQVPAEERQDREAAFREGRLPVLFCSPTMELGIDIATLNVVGMRNVPPTPANYAQRSGRAGRQGQPALITTYCSTGSSHDQFFFRRPTLMVAGAVRPPRLDLANEDLVRAHVHAVWLAETGLRLGASMTDVLDVSGEPPTLWVQERVGAALADAGARGRARGPAQAVLASLGDDLAGADWYAPGWLDEVLAGVGARFEDACGRWRDLFRAADAQRVAQNRIIGDASRPRADKEAARRLREQAEAQRALLLNEGPGSNQSDFYPYRYLASEGFLPGYNFPRLPLSAFIPGRRGRHRDEEYLSRPRFLAISEFGPGNHIYHEGSVYVVDRVMLPAGADADDDHSVLTVAMVACEACGYLHPKPGGVGPDRCQRCRAELGHDYPDLFRMVSVATRRRARISSDEEERRRQGYEVRTGYRFGQAQGRPAVRTAEVRDGGAGAGPGGPLARLSYAPAATLYRINVGWTRRRDRSEEGFRLDLERGRWARRPDEGDGDGSGDASGESPGRDGSGGTAPAEPLSGRVARVIPYVEDRRNCLLVEPAEPLDLGQAASLGAALERGVQAASLGAALERGVQAAFDLEDAELGLELLPTLAPGRHRQPLPAETDSGAGAALSWVRGDRDRRLLLVYEAAEGGAGVLRHLVDDPGALARVARAALEVCHFDPDSGEDRGRAPGAPEDCEAACYDCLMSYSNQAHHAVLDRRAIRDPLLALAGAGVEPSPAGAPRGAHLQGLVGQAGSDLEADWLAAVDRGGWRLPDQAQRLFEGARTRPDFTYDEAHVAIYVDGPDHDRAEQAVRDAGAEEALADLGWQVLRFSYRGGWEDLFRSHPGVFGRGTPASAAPAPGAPGAAGPPAPGAADPAAAPDPAAGAPGSTSPGSRS